MERLAPDCRLDAHGAALVLAAVAEPWWASRARSREPGDEVSASEPHRAWIAPLVERFAALGTAPVVSVVDHGVAGVEGEELVESVLRLWTMGEPPAVSIDAATGGTAILRLAGGSFSIAVEIPGGGPDVVESLLLGLARTLGPLLWAGLLPVPWVNGRIGAFLPWRTASWEVPPGYLAGWERATAALGRVVPDVCPWQQVGDDVRSRIEPLVAGRPDCRWEGSELVVASVDLWIRGLAEVPAALAEIAELRRVFAPVLMTEEALRPADPMPEGWRHPTRG